MSTRSHIFPFSRKSVLSNSEEDRLGRNEMVPPSAAQDVQTASARKKRKVRPRTARACIFCRRRKVRCSGTKPCEYCVKEEVPETCEYGDGPQPPNLPDTVQQEHPAGSGNIGVQASSSAERERVDTHTRSQSPQEQPNNNHPYSRRHLFEPPQMFAEDQHVGPTAGISFLYHAWNKYGRSKYPRDDTLDEQRNQASTSSVPLESYGDFPQAVLGAPQSPISNRMTADRISTTLERYFRFATPTYRYLHRPTLERWGTLYVNDDPRLGNAQRACVLLACAQSLLYTVSADKYVTEEDHDSIWQSRLCFQKAKELLDHEAGPPTLASVQSRLAMCLYMLSTFRMTSCRFCFSLTVTILMSLGLHRVHSTKSQRIDSVESESRKRTFWCAYVLDGYLAVMLGRPRIIRDEDVDQPYPRNIDDNDLMSTEPLDDLPQHGNLEAFLAHAKLARLMAKSSDLLYPLEALAEEEVLQRSNELLDALGLWRADLPNFLKPGSKTLTGERMFERQNTVLKLAHAHLQILITRRCLLSDTRSLGRHSLAQLPNLRAMRPIKECSAGITAVLDAAVLLIERGSFFHCFWYTQYIALVAISTLYIFLIQGARRALPDSMDAFIEVDSYFEKAKKCQSRLDSLSPPGSQAKRHHQLLDHLRRRVERDLANVQQASMNSAVGNDVRPHADVGATQHEQRCNIQANAPDAGETTYPFAGRQQPHLPYVNFTPLATSHEGFNNGHSVYEPNSASDIDQNIASMLDLGWTSLDTIGFMMPYDGQDLGEL